VSGACPVVDFWQPRPFKEGRGKLPKAAKNSLPGLTRVLNLLKFKSGMRKLKAILNSPAQVLQCKIWEGKGSG